MSLTQELVDRVRAISYEAIPTEVVATAKAVVLDGIGVTLAGATEPLGLGRTVMDYVRGLGGAEDATVMAAKFKSSVLNASFANGTMAHALDFDNTWYPLNHPTSPSLPAILAIAEKYGNSGRDVITALVVAFEVQGRLRMASTGLTTGSGFHKPNVTGLMGATAAGIRLLGLSEREALMAFGIAGSRASGLALNTGTMTKSTHSGNGARMGVEAVLLASMGWSAHEDVFGPGGFFDTLMGKGRYDARLLVKDFGDPFRMADPGVGFKKYPCNYFTHRGIDAALAIRRNHTISTDNVESVEVRFPHFGYVDRPQPRSGLDAKFSVQYTTAAALIDGRVDVDTFSDSRRLAPDLAAMLRKVNLVFDDAIPSDFQDTYTVVTVQFTDGHRASQRVAELTGMWGVPLTRDRLLEKYFYCAERVLPRPRASAILRQVEALDRLQDVRGIMALAGNMDG